MLKKNALVVVADGHSATLYRNTAEGAIELRAAETLAPKNLADQGAGNSPAETSPKAEDEATFARQVVEAANAMVLANTVDEVVIVADPSTLGNMRPHYHKELQARLVKELAKTLVKASPDEIARAIS